MDNTTSDVAEFIVAATHALLFTRHIYQRNVFHRQRKYDLLVPVSRNEPLNRYIAQTVTNAVPLLVAKQLAQLQVDVKEPRRQAIVESLVIKFSYTNTEDHGDVGDDLALRSVLTRVLRLSGELPAGCCELEKDTTFGFVVSTSADQFDDAAWILANESAKRGRVVDDHTVLERNHDKRMIPLGDVDVGWIRMVLYYEFSTDRDVESGVGS